MSGGMAFPIIAALLLLLIARPTAHQQGGVERRWPPAGAGDIDGGGDRNSEDRRPAEVGIGRQQQQQQEDEYDPDGETAANLPFTDCDHVFDASLRQGHFSLPMLPREATDSLFPASSAISSPVDDGEEEEQGQGQQAEGDGAGPWRNAAGRLAPFVTVSPASGEEEEASGEKAAGLVRFQSLPHIQCIYTFVARADERVRLEFSHFELAGTANHCQSEYVDVYSELESPSEDLLSASLGARYCGTVAPNVRISYSHVLVLVLHSRVGRHRSEPFALAGRFQFIPEAPFLPGRPLPGGPRGCAFLVQSDQPRGSLLSPTYPGTYPSNLHCLYLLKGAPGERIRLFFRDFDVYFGGEHCPYDSLTIYDGPSPGDPILRKLCGLQQRLELFSFGAQLLLEFNTTEPPKSDLRGFVIDYEFSSRFVDLGRLIGTQRSVSHLRGSECDIRVRSDRESVHYVHSPNFPDQFPPNTTCTYVLDGLQSDQNLEKVLLRLETLALPDRNNASGGNSPPAPVPALQHPHSQQSPAPEECSSGSFLGIATTAASIKAVLSNSEESQYDALLCERLPPGSSRLGPYVSQGPRMVLIFSSADRQSTGEEGRPPPTGTGPLGFRARVEFKTDFGIAGESIGGSNRCAFRFHDPRGSFNSPRYPANYPLDTECTYYIVGQSGTQILLHFKQFALFEDNSKEECHDWLQIFDVFHESDGTESLQLQAKHCSRVFPGPTISSFGAHEMRVVFHSDGFGTANGFDAHYEIREAFKEEVPSRPDKLHCGELIQAGEQRTTGHFESPGFPVKYSTNKQCDWEIRVRPGHQVLLKPTMFNVEGQMTEEKVDCMSAVLRVHLDMNNRSQDLQLCGENVQAIAPIVSPSNSIRLSFLTSPDKVNGLQGFNFSWTEVRRVKSDSECNDELHYLCSYTQLCIDARLRCNGDENCGKNDDSDEAHCSRIEAADMRTIVVAYIVSGCIFLFILSFFCVLFKSKLERKRLYRGDERKRRQKGGRKEKGGGRRGNANGQSSAAGPRLRQPYRGSTKPRGQRHLLDRHRPSGALTTGGGGGGEDRQMENVLRLVDDHDFGAHCEPDLMDNQVSNISDDDDDDGLSPAANSNAPQQQSPFFPPTIVVEPHQKQQPVGPFPRSNADANTNTIVLSLGHVPSVEQQEEEAEHDWDEEKRDRNKDVRLFYG